jgi:hypothetical protein
MRNKRSTTAAAKELEPSPRIVEAVPALPESGAPFKLFRRCDWIAAGSAFVIALTINVYLMAPSETLEDSGELVTAAHNLGVPHPPGYPIWTVLGFLFDHLIQLKKDFPTCCVNYFSFYSSW